MIKEHESETEILTRSANPNEVVLCQLALDTVLDGFTTLGGEMEWDDERRGNTLLLATLAYNSLRWAFELMLKAYYAQSVALSRTAWEAWLNAAYLQLFPERSIEDWRDVKKRPRPGEMRELVAARSAAIAQVDGVTFQAGLDQLYSRYCEYSHPTGHSLRILISEKGGNPSLALGGEYAEVLVLESTDMLCNAAVLVATLFAYILSDASSYMARREVFEKKWAAWGREVRRRYEEGEFAKTT